VKIKNVVIIGGAGPSEVLDLAHTKSSSYGSRQADLRRRADERRKNMAPCTLGDP
jgi:hypothetical protein